MNHLLFERTADAVCLFDPNTFTIVDCSEARFRSFFERNADAMSLFDPQTLRYIEVNEAAARLIGAPSRDALRNDSPVERWPERQPDGRLSIEKVTEMINRKRLRRFARGQNQLAQVVATQVKNGCTFHLPPSSVSETAIGSWRSPVTGITYPSGWTVTVPGGVLDITPLQKDQELVVAASVAGAYWEGDSVVSGVIDGRPVRGVSYAEVAPPACPRRHPFIPRCRFERPALSSEQVRASGGNVEEDFQALFNARMIRASRTCRGGLRLPPSACSAECRHRPTPPRR